MLCECPYKTKCPYYQNTIGLPLISWETVLNAYCLGKTEECARFVIYRELSASGVPVDLRPDQQGRAHDILSCSFYS